jgi:glycosyltransferase involved in cell wall biosynthesis
MAKKISVVVPINNEEGNIRNVVEGILEVYKERGINGEIILVDDGSTDSSHYVCKKLSDRYRNVKCCRHGRKLGVSRALKTGFDNSKGSILMFFSGNGQYDPEDIASFVDNIKDGGYDVVVGRINKRGDSFTRRWASRVGHYIFNSIYGTNFKSVNSLKAFTREAFNRFDWNSDGILGFHKVCVAAALYEGLSIGEVDIKHYPRMYGRSKTRPYLTSLTSLVDLIRLRGRYIRRGNRYERRSYR